jgi:Uma2 family endonuclease
MTANEYRQQERVAEYRSEFYRGQACAMAGANARHNLICSSLASILVLQLRPLGCNYFGSDMKVFVPRTGLYTYPDGAIACGELQFEDSEQDVLLNPCVLIEVLSKSTERRDRGWKFQNYWNIPSLVEYLLVSQQKPLVEQFVRSGSDIWSFRHYDGLEAIVELNAVACKIDLRTLYLDVAFDTKEEEDSGTVDGPAT